MNWLPEQRLHEVAEGIVTVVHGNGEVGVSNASFVIEGDRAFVVDTMTFPEMATGMVREIARRGARVETVLNTHHHIDHIGGNKLFADAQIFAHPESIRSLERLGFPTKMYDRLMPQFRGHFDDLELVTPVPIEEQLTMPREGELHIFTPAHTAADTAVWFPEARVLLSGDLCFIGVVPLSVNSLISGWIEALDALIALKPSIVVPGHGPIGTLPDLVNLRYYFIDVQRIGRQAVTEHLSLADALSLLDPGPLADWIESERHEINLERAMQEARGEISRQDLSARPQSVGKL
jgi:glyoxylase-like metal-dependent hydrolase (beta-lactamase superfamily II)